VSANPLTVRFSDGTNLTVPAGKTVTSGALTWSGGNASGGVVVPDPTTPTPGPTTPSPDPTTPTPGPTTPSPDPTTPTPGPTTPTPGPTTPGPTTPPCSPTGTLLSQGRTATASSNSAQAARAVDGNRGTRWTSTASNNQWLRVDLGAARTIGKVELDWHTSYGRGYQIQTSADGVTWTTVHTTTDGTGGRELVDAKGTGRHVRFQGTARGTSGGYSLYEFRVYAACPDPVVATRHLQADGALAAAAGPAGTVALTAAAGNHDGSPVNARVFTATGVSGTHTGAATRFDLGVDAGSNVGNGTQVRVSYDLTGDGTWERVETYRYFATDPVPGAERYTEAQGLSSGVGTLGDLVNGQVKVEVWNAIGSTASTLAVGAGSTVTLPLR
ncbi:discoidin domain-containing protein, partial [Spirilliplanes yamanashiensis]